MYILVATAIIMENMPRIGIKLVKSFVKKQYFNLATDLCDVEQPNALMYILVRYITLKNGLRTFNFGLMQLLNRVDEEVLN